MLMQKSNHNMLFILINRFLVAKAKLSFIGTGTWSTHCRWYLITKACTIENSIIKYLVKHQQGIMRLVDRDLIRALRPRFLVSVST